MSVGNKTGWQPIDALARVGNTAQALGALAMLGGSVWAAAGPAWAFAVMGAALWIDAAMTSAAWQVGRRA